jgi:hypothetical protein
LAGFGFIVFNIPAKMSEGIDLLRFTGTCAVRTGKVLKRIDPGFEYNALLLRNTCA